jgi:hypothetical protein
MQTSGLAQALLEDIAAAAALGDEKTAELAERLGAALEGPVRLRLMEAMTEAAAELTHQLPSGHVEVRLAGGDVELVYVGEPEPSTPRDDVLDARMTLRLPESLKGYLERAASEEGVSVNTWVVRGLSRNVGQKRAVGHRLTGFARS